MKTMEAIMQPTGNQPQAVCRSCGVTFDLPDFAIAAQFVKTCPDCSLRDAEAAQEKAKLEAHKRLHSEWEAFCPAAFLDTDTAKLPNPAKFLKVMQFRFSAGRGMVLHGETSKGKSRCMWKLLEREFLAGRKIKVIDSRITYHFAGIFDKPNGAEKWIDSLIKVELLAFDDVFKAKLSEGIEQAIFTIIDQRMIHKRPFILTSNDTGESLKSRLSNDRAEPLVRRLRDFCDSIHF